MRNAVVYARYSSERQNEQSIEGQLAKCNEFAEMNGLNIVDTYIDRAMTGTNDNRPAFQQMLADCAKPVPWDVVLIYAIDRFGRDSIEIAVNKQKLKKNGKTLISATQRTSQNIDGSKNLDGILLENVYIGMAEYYSAELSQKVRRGLDESRKKGLFTGGHVPYGYKVEDRHIIPHPEEAPVVLYIFQQYSQGAIARDIIDDLSRRGIYKKGKPFAQNTIYGMLRLSKYRGVYTFEGVDYTDMYPALVPPDLFDKVQCILAKNKVGKKSRDADFLLKGKISCGHCNRHLFGDSGTSRNGNIRYYYTCMGRKKIHVCNKSITPKDKLEQLVLDITNQVFLNSSNVEIIADALIAAIQKRLNDGSRLKLLQSEREEVKRSVNNIMKAIEQGIFTATTKARLEELEQQLSDIESNIAIEETKQKRQLKRENIIEFIRHTIKKDPKILIRNLIQSIKLYDDKIEIYYNYVENMPPTDDNNPDNSKECEDYTPITIQFGADMLHHCPPRKRTR